MSERKDPAESDKRIENVEVTDDAPATADPGGRVEDRHGNELKRGDHVEIVYGGNYHRTTIDKISRIKTNAGVTTDHHLIEATITIEVHAAAVIKLKDATKHKTHEHKPTDASNVPGPQSSHPKTTPAAAADEKAHESSEKKEAHARGKTDNDPEPHSRMVRTSTNPREHGTSYLSKPADAASPQGHAPATHPAKPAESKPTDPKGAR